jgi:hypothetical protein
MNEYRILHKEWESFGIVEHEVHQFAAEASSLGFPVGQFPEKILTDMGNGQPLILDSKKVCDGDLMWVVYRQALGCISLKVFND